MSKTRRIKHLFGRKEGKKIREELLARALEGKEINVEACVDEFWEYKNQLQYMECKDQMYGYIVWLQNVLDDKFQLPFRSMDGQGTYKVPQNEEEFEVVALRHLRKVKATSRSNVLLAKHAKDKLKLASGGTKRLPFSIVAKSSNPLEDNGHKRN